MVALPEQNLTTQAIYKSYVDKQTDYRRDYIGGSVIGHPCDRALWYAFRWCAPPGFDGRMLRLFETGNINETRVIKDLKRIGVELYDLDPKTGRQFHFELFNGHFKANLDAAGRNFPEAPKTWHVVEIKSCNTKTYLELQSIGVKKAKPEYYAQMQAYMGMARLDRAFFFAVCKDTDEIYQERVPFDKEIYRQLVERAKYIIFSEVPPSGVAVTPDFYQCKWCEFSDICHLGALPEVSCRTCAFSTPCTRGRWSCGRIGKTLDQVEQHKGCDWHAFIPALVGLEVVDANAEEWTVSYKIEEKIVVNGLTGVPSRILGEVIKDSV